MTLHPHTVASRRPRAVVSLTLAALAVASITSPEPVAALTNWAVGDVGPEHQGRIPRFGDGGCADSEPRFEWLTKKVPKYVSLVADPVEDLEAARRTYAELTPIEEVADPEGGIIRPITGPYCPPGVVCVDMPSPSDPMQRYVPLDHDGLGHAVGYVRTISETDADHDHGGGGGPLEEAEIEKEVLEVYDPIGMGMGEVHPVGVSIGNGSLELEELEEVPVELEPADPLYDELKDRWQAAFFHDGEVVLLDTPSGYDSIAYAIDKPEVLSDDPRWIVGMIVDAQGEYTAVVWINGTRHVLSELINTPDGWNLQIATDLDERGYVLGVGNHSTWDHPQRVFVGRLIPEPLAVERTGGDIGIEVGVPWGPPNVDFCARWSHLGGRRGQSHCDNGGFENNNFDEWKGRYSKADWIKDGEKKSYFKNGFVTGAAPNARHSIMHVGDGYDTLVGGTLLPVVAPGSTYSAMLGNKLGGDHSEILMRKIKISEDTKLFRFNFAVVMRDASHTPDIQPSFEVRVLKGKDSNGFAGIFHPEIYKREFVADGSDPLFYTDAPGDVIYTPWRCHLIDLSDYVDKWVTVVFQTRDCGLSDHSGYAYIDSVCGDDALASAGDVVLEVETNVCPSNDGIWADGSLSAGAISAHFWSVQESTAGWVGVGPEVYSWFAGPPGVKDIQQFANDKGLPMRCGKHYRVKLALTNECATWTDKTKLIYLDCPVIDAGADQWICLGDSANIAVTGPLPPSYNFLGWSTSSGGAVSTDLATTVSPTTSTTYIATVEDTADGNCQGWDDVFIGVVSQPIAQVVILHEPVCDCTNRRRLRAYAWGQESAAGTFFLWSTGETTPTIVVDNPGWDPYQVAYSVTVSNACGAASAVTVVEQIGTPLSFYAANTFFPNSGQVHTVWHAGTSAGIKPSYSKWTTFRVFDRWGGILHEQTARCADMRPNGWLQWDGTYETTNFWGNTVTRTVPSGTYNWHVEYDDKCDGSAPTIEAYHVNVLR